ncbi:hypothetical protein XI06_20200 [Bradyrhizobium sp. CCBAU 11434]|uniref:hypothetical protein n=1 Tax=Bradyrhizobium sp. CCBAU 11434 TaxID=1630885 RepID=UPI0023055C83|nr:hypothetical protein [Bradyrhizobium sp. CCBAU 11434]MDA9522542.1 hypothetical protein [Bradyrhizobium sp. CCBAU 11434]
MFTIRRHPRPNVVVSPKAKGALPAHGPLARDLAIQAVLDPSVHAVEYRHRVVHGGQVVDARSLVVDKPGGRFLLDLTGEHRSRGALETRILEAGLERDGIRRIEVAADTVRREPRRGNARAVWARRDFPVPHRIRSRLLDALTEHGPLTIAELENEVASSVDVEASVYRLICDNLIEIDLDAAPLGAATMVRIRR